MTRQNAGQLDEFQALAGRYGAQLRLTRLRPSGRGADVWDELHPTAAQQRQLYDWLCAHGEQVLTGDSFFHLAAYGEALPGLNMCGAGRVVCLIDPVGDVYACPFAIHENFLAGNVRDGGRLRGGLAGLRAVRRAARAARAAPAAPASSTTPAGAAAWPRSSSPGCRWTARTRSASAASASRPWLSEPGPGRRWPGRTGPRSPGPRWTTRTAAPCVGSPCVGSPCVGSPCVRLARPVPVTIGRRPVPAPPDRACDISPLAGFEAGGAR